MSRPDLLVIRHGETQWNRDGRLQGRQDQPLTLNGVRQAMAVAATLRPVVAGMSDPVFWVSPLGRARQTASLLADSWGEPFAGFRADERVVELSYGRWEGMTHAEFSAEYPKAFAAFEADRWQVPPPGGETWAALTQRLAAWLEELDGSRPHVLVTHSGCLRALRGIYTGAPQAEILAYREPQTTAYRLTAAGEEAIAVPERLLAENGCEGSGRTVAF